MHPLSELAATITRHTVDGGEGDTVVPGLWLGCRNERGDPRHATQWPCFAMVVQGAKSMTLGDEVYRYGVGDYLVVSLDLPVVSKTIEASPEIPYIGLALAIDPERLRELFSRVPPPERALTTDARRGVAVEKAGPELLDATLRLVRLLDRPHEIAAMAPLIEQEILYRLLMSPYGPRLMSIATADSPSNRVAKAGAWLKANFRRPLRIDDLAERVGMSVSSLHHHFKAVTAMTPMQYQKQLRLQEANRLLLIDRCDVATAGHRVGYESPSQFTREYTRLYGLPPTRHIESLRTPMAAE
ncbi:HTH-type transcriptional activator RhaS [Alphaproteobacteria bacterium SO-S41]|nr:HTH-type transcriptional activator RhaS [Alphaproteobacteria bacterium SO-S41]